MPRSAIATLEHAARYQQDDAISTLTNILRRLATGTKFSELGSGEPDTDELTLATRLAAALAQIIVNPKSRLNDAAALRLTATGGTINNLFTVSGFGKTDHILTILGATDTEGFRRIQKEDRQSLTKAWLLLSIDSNLDVDIKMLLEIPPALGLLAAMKLMAQKPIMTKNGHKRREELVRIAGSLKPMCLPLSADLLVLLSSAWMLCSYAESRDKHSFKPVLNKVLRQWGESIGLADLDLPARRIKQDRPTLLVAAEIMHSNHVQYRYFGQYLRQLKQRFRLVLITEESQVDENVKALFEEIHTFKRGGNLEYLKSILDTARSIRPDVVFWLSVGMRHWGPVMANFRLAPIQLAGLGHSASTFCETIDYYFTEEGYVGDTTLLSEQLVLLPDASLIFEKSPHYKSQTPCIRQSPEVLRIALASNLLKLNPSFISILRQIRDSSLRPIEFRVFPNASGLDLTATQRVFEQELPGSIVNPVMNYNSYLSSLNECDISLSPFPFGGLHSVVDSLRQGIPVIALEGDELHSRTDAMFLRRLGLPEWLITKNTESYINAALRLINNDSERLELSQRLVEADLDQVLFGDGTSQPRNEVVEAMWWIYQNHETIKASGKKAFYQEDYMHPQQ